MQSLNMMTCRCNNLRVMMSCDITSALTDWLMHWSCSMILHGFEWSWSVQIIWTINLLCSIKAWFETSFSEHNWWIVSWLKWSHQSITCDATISRDIVDKMIDVDRSDDRLERHCDCLQSIAESIISFIHPDINHEQCTTIILCSLPTACVHMLQCWLIHCQVWLWLQVIIHVWWLCVYMMIDSRLFDWFNKNKIWFHVFDDVTYLKLWIQYDVIYH